MKYYFVTNKSDDYGNCIKELVQTTLKNAKQYYSCREVLDEDIETLKKYFYLVEYEEEKQRTKDQRFYGQ